MRPRRRSSRRTAPWGVSRPVPSFRPRLLAVVANEAKNRRKVALRRANLALRAEMESTGGNAPPSPEATILAAERRAELLHALGGLREEDRLVIAFRYFLGLSEAETPRLWAAHGGLSSPRSHERSAACARG
jgi:DNA-directed RNA polymerase specialized sigma24 family protein